MPRETIASVKAELEAAQQRIESLEGELSAAEDVIAKRDEAIEGLKAAPSGGPVYVRWCAGMVIPNKGVTAQGAVSRNPSAEALALVPHTVTDGDAHASAPGHLRMDFWG